MVSRAGQAAVRSVHEPCALKDENSSTSVIATQSASPSATHMQLKLPYSPSVSQ